MNALKGTGMLAVVATLLLLTTCHKEMFDLDRLSTEIELEPQLVAPVVYGQVSMEDARQIFDSADYVGEFDDGLIYLAYVDTLVTATADTAIDIPDFETQEIYVDSDEDFDILLPVPIGDTAYIDKRVKVVDYTLEGGNRLDNVLVKNGTILLELTYTFKHAGTLTISSQEIFQKGGEPFTHTIVIDDDGGDFYTQVEIPSDSFLIVPRTIQDSSFIFMEFDLALINSGSPIAPGDGAVIKAIFQDMEFYRVYGFVDYEELTGIVDTLEVPLYTDNPEFAAIELADPRINIILASSVGVPFEIDLDSVIAYGLEGEVVPLQLNGGNTLEFFAPGFDQQGETVTTRIEINNTTSNIDEFINSAPVKILINADGRTTMTGEDTVHFVLEKSRVDLSVDLLLPLDFRSSGFALSDTLDFSLGEDGIDTALIRYAEVALETRNELPIELLTQVYFMDENQVVVDSLFETDIPLLGASIVDVNTGRLVEATEELHAAILTAEKLTRIQEAESLMFRARLTSSSGGEPFVKIYSQYNLDFKLTVLADVRINNQQQ